MTKTTGESVGKTGGAKTTSRSRTPKKAEPVSENAVQNEPTVVQAAENSAPDEQPANLAKKAAPVKYQVKSSIDPDMYVTVRNGFHGKLIYKSVKTGERWVWEKFGDEQDLELRELRVAKTSYKGFFANNWFMIDDPEVIAYLGLERYYANALSYEEFDTIFEQSPEEISRRIALLSDGQKVSLAYRAKELIRDGGIDSLKVIDAVEKSLGIALIER